MNNAAIDWGAERLGKLYLKILIPTVLGMLSSIIVTVVNGIFVGQFVGGDGLAVINIGAPIYLLSSAIALMLGAGCSVVASIHLSKGVVEEARRAVTQVFVISATLFTVLLLVASANSDKIALLLGSTERLQPMVSTYVRILSLSLPFCIFQYMGQFIIRLDGSPKYAMLSMMIPVFIKLVLDYIFMGLYDMGIEGAVTATAINFVVGGMMVLYYMFCRSQTLRFYLGRLSFSSLVVGLKNIVVMCKLGFATFLGEMAIALLLFVGNIVFLKYYGEDGIAAYSIICYYFTVVFMLNNAIAHSAQPIISYAYGANLESRVKGGLHLMIKYAVTFALVTTAIFVLFAPNLVGLFLSQGEPAYEIASRGMPLFAVGYIFFALNVVFMEYYQSIKGHKIANTISALRGYLFMLISFFALPLLLGKVGVWLAIPLAELLTFIVVLLIYFIRGKR